jgi:uncharacterized ferredoxin-like protein
MPILSSDASENEGLLQAAKMLLVSARTAPKSGGVDDILTAIVLGKEKESLADEMDRIADERKIAGFKRDAKNLRDSSVAVIIGVRGTRSYGLNCGACGHATCAEFDETEKQNGQDFAGPNCLFKSLDLGIAIGSAVKTASALDVDNRIMYRVGTAARSLNLLPEASVIMGIPVSAKGKNIYFDRPAQ